MFRPTYDANKGKAEGLDKEYTKVTIVNVCYIDVFFAICPGCWLCEFEYVVVMQVLGNSTKLQKLSKEITDILAQGSRVPPDTIKILEDAKIQADKAHG